MTVSGAQDFWVVGARAYFKPTGNKPWRDLGILQTVTPNFTTETIELDDPDGGIKQTADKKNTKITENYDLTCSNLNVKNLSFMFLADEPTEVTVGATEVSHVTTQTYIGSLLQILDASSEPVRMTEIAGVYTGSVTIEANDVTAIDASAKTITVTSDQSLLVDQDQIIVSPGDLVNKKNADTYTVASVSGTGPTIITVYETPAANETGLTATNMIHDGSGTVYDKDTDWSVHNEDRGLLKFIEGGAFVTDMTAVTVVYWQYAISGVRRIVPQSQAEIEGSMRLVFSRDTFAREGERFIPKLKITPGTANFQVDDFSNVVFNVEVLADDSVLETVGHYIEYKGDVPAKS